MTFLESVALLCVDTKGKWLVSASSELLQTHNRKHKVRVKRMYNVIGICKQHVEGCGHPSVHL